MDNLAKKLINDHRNPIVKVDLSGSKLFLRTSTQEEVKFIERHQANLENILSHERAERRCARSQATWLPENKLAKVSKTMKYLNNFGYQEKNGTYLYPEEALFLMETNRLEVRLNEVPLSIQEGYNLLLTSSVCDTIKYRVYKKLALLGYRVLRYSELLRRFSRKKKKLEIEPNKDSLTEDAVTSNRKRVSDTENEELNAKRKKLEELESQNSLTVGTRTPSGANSKQLELQDEYIRNLFDKLRGCAPKQYESNSTDDVVPQYCVFLPNNKSRCEYDFNLYICEESILEMKQSNHSVPSIFAVCSQGNISFYKFSTVKLPFL